MDHADRIDEASDALRHTDRLTAIQRITELLQRVQVFHVVLGFVRRIRQLVVVLIPRLQRATSHITAVHNASTRPNKLSSSFL